MSIVKYRSPERRGFNVDPFGESLVPPGLRSGGRFAGLDSASHHLLGYNNNTRRPLRSRFAAIATTLVGLTGLSNADVHPVEVPKEQPLDQPGYVLYIDTNTEMKEPKPKPRPHAWQPRQPSLAVDIAPLHSSTQPIHLSSGIRDRCGRRGKSPTSSIESSEPSELQILDNLADIKPVQLTNALLAIPHPDEIRTAVQSSLLLQVGKELNRILGVSDFGVEAALETLGEYPFTDKEMQELLRGVVENISYIIVKAVERGEMTLRQVVSDLRRDQQKAVMEAAQAVVDLSESVMKGVESWERLKPAARLQLTAKMGDLLSNFDSWKYKNLIPKGILALATAITAEYLRRNKGAKRAIVPVAIAISYLCGCAPPESDKTPQPSASFSTTPSPTSTETGTPTSSPTPTATFTPTRTNTPRPSDTPTATATETATATIPATATVNAEATVRAKNKQQTAVAKATKRAVSAKQTAIAEITAAYENVIQYEKGAKRYVVYKDPDTIKGITPYVNYHPVGAKLSLVNDPERGQVIQAEVAGPISEGDSRRGYLGWYSIDYSILGPRGGGVETWTKISKDLFPFDESPYTVVLCLFFYGDEILQDYERIYGIYSVGIGLAPDGAWLMDSKVGGLLRLRDGIIKPNTWHHLEIIVAPDKNEVWRIFPFVDGVLALRPGDQAPKLPTFLLSQSKLDIVGGHPGLYTPKGGRKDFKQGAKMWYDDFSVFGFR